jgi:phage FluMu protein Com
MKPPVYNGVKLSPAKDWRCADPNCKTLLGKRHSHGLLILKYKDFLAEVSGNYNVSTRCRRCSLLNTLSSESHGLLSLLKEKNRKES